MGAREELLALVAQAAEAFNRAAQGERPASPKGAAEWQAARRAEQARRRARALAWFERHLAAGALEPAGDERPAPGGRTTRYRVRATPLTVEVRLDRDRRLVAAQLMLGAVELARVTRELAAHLGWALA